MRAARLVDGDERRTQALDLLFRRGPHVGRRNDAAEAPAGGDRLQPGNTGAHDQNARRFDRSGRGHHHREGAAELGSGIDDGLVAREIGLRGQHVHGLCAGDPRHQLHRKGGNPGAGIGLGVSGVLGRLQQADQHRPAFEQRQLVDAALAADQRTLDLEDDVRIAQRRRLIRRNRGSGLGERGIAEPGAFARAAFHDDLEGHPAHAPDGIGRRRHPAFERAPFLDDGDFHGPDVPQWQGRKTRRTMPCGLRFVKSEPGQHTRASALVRFGDRVQLSAAAYATGAVNYGRPARGHLQIQLRINGGERAGNKSSGGPLSVSQKLAGQKLAESSVRLIPGRDPVSIRFGDQLIAVLPRLRRFARGLTGSAVEADDLVQAACERALARQHQFQEGTRFDSWMFRIVQTIWIDQVRSRDVRKEGGEIAEERMGSDEAVRRVEARLALAEVRRAVDRLPPDQRTALLLVTVDGLSYKETAEIVGVPMGTIMSRLARARIALQLQLEAGGGMRRSTDNAEAQ